MELMLSTPVPLIPRFFLPPKSRSYQDLLPPTPAAIGEPVRDSCAFTGPKGLTLRWELGQRQESSAARGWAGGTSGPGTGIRGASVPKAPVQGIRTTAAAAAKVTRWAGSAEARRPSRRHLPTDSTLSFYEQSRSGQRRGLPGPCCDQHRKTGGRAQVTALPSAVGSAGRRGSAPGPRHAACL